MKLKNIAIILATSVVLNGCSNQVNPYSEGTTYGVADEKWSMMSLHQREAAKELFEIENEKIAAQNELNNLKARMATANALRKREQNEDQERINQQQRTVDLLARQQAFKQQQRERELEGLKQSSASHT